MITDKKQPLNLAKSGNCLKPLLPAGRIIQQDLKRNKMSLDVYLTRKKWVSYDEAKTHTEENEEVYWANITHNLGKMAAEAGIYEALWRPEEIGKTKASEIVELLEKGLADLKARPEHFETFNSPNGWGMYEHFVPFVEKYLEACKEYPDAVIEVSR
jgi:hypothetical protein